MTPSALFFPPLMKKLALIDLTERLSPRSRAWLAHSWGSAAARHTVMEQGAVTPEQGREGTLPPFSLALIGTRSSNAPRKMCPIMVLFCRVQIRQKTSGHREVLIKKKNPSVVSGLVYSSSFHVRQHFPGEELRAASPSPALGATLLFRV